MEETLEDDGESLCRALCRAGFFMENYECFCTCVSQCSDYSDFIVVLVTRLLYPYYKNIRWGEAGTNTAQSNLNPIAAFCVCIAPGCLKPRSMQEVPEQFWEVFCKGMRKYTAWHYAGSKPTSACNYTFQKT